MRPGPSQKIEFSLSVRSDAAPSGEHLKPYVREELDALSMHFSVCEIQSRMQIRCPDRLALEYTRTMMGFLLFKPEPQRIAMVGLGGGSLAKFCHRHLPKAALVVAEINPHVIALRGAFQVPPDDARFQVIRADGAHFVSQTEQRFDVLLVDAFDVQGMPPTLGAQRFYDDCADVLLPGGVLVVNLHAGHPHCPVYLGRIRAAFGANVLRVDDADGSNSVVFACRGEPLRLAAKPFHGRPMLPPDAAAQLRGAFTRVTTALRKVAD